MDSIALAGGLFLLALLTAATVLSRRAAWTALAMLFGVCSISKTFGASTLEGDRFTWPLNLISDNIYIFTGVLLTVLILQALTLGRSPIKSQLTVPAIFLVLLQFYYGVRLILAGSAFKGPLILITFMLMALLFLFALPNMIRNSHDVRRLILAQCGGGAFFLIMTGYQALFNRSLMTQNSRFSGIAINPNFAAYMLATVIPPAIWLLLDRDSRGPRKVALQAFTALCALLLMWTGSRGACLSAMVACAFVLRHRLGAMVFYGGGVLVFAMLIAQLLPEGSTSTERFRTLQDTRSAVWTALWAEFMKSPLWGSGGSTFGFSENSYLAAGAQLGIIGFGLIVGFLVSSLYEFQRMISRRGRSPELDSVADLVMGGIAGMLAMGMFEAHLMGAFVSEIYALFGYLTLLGFVRRRFDALDAAPASPQASNVPPSRPGSPAAAPFGRRYAAARR